jgi:hypothetical protein
MTILYIPVSPVNLACPRVVPDRVKHATESLARLKRFTLKGSNKAAAAIDVAAKKSLANSAALLPYIS